MDVLEKLKGGDLRSIGRADEVVSDILENDGLFERVFEGMQSEDAIVRMRACDAIEKVSRIKPYLLDKHKDKLINEVAAIEQQEVRWHLAQIFSRLDLEESEVKKIVELLKDWINMSKSNIVKVNSIQCLFDLTLHHTHLKPLLIEILNKSMEKGSPSVKSRVKKLYLSLADTNPNMLPAIPRNAPSNITVMERPKTSSSMGGSGIKGRGPDKPA
ncbi:hypothetical protein OXPF_24140 [Oxobacter pfennigii]|uniref:HEAT repeat protein n=1 Tax=Oxobacter pfennigii TaxID=36849 RepID=A0A0P8X0G2_9CLOT|nr:hypothetical protein OXPF_24140 [Oxobacter pfennigii]